jgi:hypothetical protein
MPFFFMLTGLRTRIDPSPAVFLEIFLVTMIFGLMGKGRRNGHCGRPVRRDLGLRTCVSVH